MRHGGSARWRQALTQVQARFACTAVEPKDAVWVCCWRWCMACFLCESMKPMSSKHSFVIRHID
jgi:hypothetical protein